MELGRITTIYRYAVKSMAGETLDSATIDTLGLPGDRGWAVRDEVRGGIRGAKKIPALMKCSARYVAEPQGTSIPPAEITLPDGRTIMSNAESAAKQLSEAVGHQVTLWPRLPADALDHYRRGAPDKDDLEQELRSIFGREANEPLPDLDKFPPEIFEYESPPGTYFDAFPLLLLTEDSLRHMQAAAPESVFDVRRFRPNFLIETGGSSDPLPELGWTTCRLRIGTAEILTTIDCPRCVMTTHGFADLPRDPKVMRALVREAGGKLGIYASVARPGMVRVGDSVTLVEPLDRRPENQL
jgi:uncharacterized protein YcbX